MVRHGHCGVSRRCREHTAGRGADLIYDPVGGETFERSQQVIAPEGRLLVIGFASGSFGRVDAQHVLARNYSVVGAIPSTYTRTEREAMHEALLERLASGAIRPLVGATFPFEALPEALAALSDRSLVGKIVLTP